MLFGGCDLVRSESQKSKIKPIDRTGRFSIKYSPSKFELGRIRTNEKNRTRPNSFDRFRKLLKSDQTEPVTPSPLDVATSRAVQFAFHGVNNDVRKTH